MTALAAFASDRGLHTLVNGSKGLDTRQPNDENSRQPFADIRLHCNVSHVMSPAPAKVPAHPSITSCAVLLPYVFTTYVFDQGFQVSGMRALRLLHHPRPICEILKAASTYMQRGANVASKLAPVMLGTHIHTHLHAHTGESAIGSDERVERLFGGPQGRDALVS